jgi:hypothetical protein
MRAIRLLMLAMLVAHAPAAAAAESKPSSYEELVARLQSGDTAIDFQALRFAYAETPDFDPYARPVVDRRDLIRAINSGRLGDALGLANTILAKNYTDMDAHYASFLVYDQRGDTARAEFHRAVVQGLMKSFADSGDGMSENTAMVVVTEAEEYSYIGLKGYQVVRQGLMPSNSGPVDALAVTTPDNQGTTIYFNISRIFRKLKPASDALPPTP